MPDNQQLLSSSTCLIHELSNELLTRFGQDLSRVLVVLPTARLGQYLIGQLAHMSRATFLPSITTLESLVNDLIDTPEADHIDETAVEILLTHTIETTPNLKHVNKGHAHELKQLYSDLIDNHHEKTGYSQAFETIKKDVYRSEDHLQSLRERLKEIEKVFQEFRTLLQNKGHEIPQLSKRDWIASHTHIAQELAQKWDSIFFVGLTTMKKSYIPLMEAIARESNVHFRISRSPQLFGNVEPLTDLALSLGIAPSSQAYSSHVSQKHEVVEANSLYEEISSITDIVKQYLRAGVPASRIGVVLTEEAHYAQLLKSFFEKNGIESNFAVSQKLTDTLIGQTLGALTDFIVEQEKSHHLRELIKNPWIETLLSQEGENKKALETFDQSLGNFHYPSTLDGYIAESKNEYFKKLLRSLKSHLEPFLTDAIKPVNLWIEEISKLLTLIIPAPQDIESIDIHKSACEVIEETLKSFEQTAHFVPIELDSREFLTSFLNQLLGSEVRQVGYPLKGVQVISLTESRYVPFEITILAGAIEGSFPKAQPSDTLVDNWLKVEMGLPGWKYVEALEDTTFHLLSDRSSKLIMSYSHFVLNTPAIRSRYIDHLLREGKAITKFYGAESYHSNVRPKPDERVVFSPVHLPERNIEQIKRLLTEKISASSLSYLMTCPYRYLLNRGRVEKNRLPEDNKALFEGTLLHKILEELFKMEFDPKSPAVEECLSVNLNQLTDLHAPDYFKKSALAAHLKRTAWPRLAAFLNLIFKDGSWQESSRKLKEWRFGYRKESPQHIQIGQYSITIRGTIDSMDMGSFGTMITDYKTKNHPSAKEVSEGESPQLLLYQMAAQGTRQDDRWILGYWSILNGEWKGVAVSEEALPESKSLRLASGKTPDLSTSLQLLSKRWEQKITDILEPHGSFKAIPSPTKWCVYCDYDLICREVTS